MADAQTSSLLFTPACYTYNQTADQISTVLNYVAESDDLIGASQFVQTRIERYISNPRYYFQVNEEYVKNKLKVVLFPFLHKGHWMRTVEGDGGKLKLTFKPPMDDVNAPDLYIPVMAFATYVLLAGFLLGFHHKFSPEMLSVQFNTGLLCWLLQVLLVEATLHVLGGGGDVPLLDIIAYSGYTFVGASVVLATRLFTSSLYHAVALFESFCMGVFLVKTMKRILISEVQSFEKNSTKRNYVLLFMASAQIPLLFLLGTVGL
ncbi:uncharacterized protein LOC127263517 isoform X2 [Andrographis paniculata]|uniref:uncharacterized protein LOC127263517 isoform X2 n=1 Tax=Andrographis paniculata TaxID=175694 RepID=UPI0021E87BB2|nr:uncharacterized protein LOC127263517 isoform X2 [Andrographis paniculata]